jgi:antirestriction protein ArdC
MKADIYQTVTDAIIAQIESGTMPWLKPWKSSTAGDAMLPHNALTGRPYNGINWLLLAGSAYLSTGWLTFKQAQELGGNVKQGEKATQIVFWQFNRVKDSESGEEKTVPFCRAYYVFNVEQCEGLDVSKLKLPAAPVHGSTNINALCASLGANVRHGGNRAFYSLATDQITIPSADAFKSTDHYASTLAHELTHWTGHKSRCNREFGARFGDDAYAFEELIAEIGSAFVCAATGIKLESLQHADYLANWLSVLKADKRAIFTAASKAKAAAEYILGDHAEKLPIAA